MLAVLVPVRTVMALHWRNERAARRAGRDPRWPARLPVHFARELGMSVPARLGNDVELLGQLTRRATGWQWAPTRQQAKMGVTAIELADVPGSASIRPIWDPWQQDLLLLPAVPDRQLPLWVRHPRDLANYLPAEIPR